ncbi:MAG: CHAP domain-containing protein [Oscillibacter sp.]|nr:CHAP domain-containing protein [Oscillibacter sp.]
MLESELREHYVDTLRGWVGAKEGGAIHKRIIDTYNSLKPLPRNYPVQYGDPWCAATVSAAAIEAGLTDIIPRECSCARMIELFKKMKRWEEDDAFSPQPGDIIFYDWDDGGKGDNTGAPDHVGVVERVAGGAVTVIEGNYRDAVGRRHITVNNRYIRGYGLPDYASLSDSPPPAAAKTPAAKPLTNGGRVRAMDNAELAAFLENLPPLADGQSWRDWLDALTEGGGSNG